MIKIRKSDIKWVIICGIIVIALIIALVLLLPSGKPAPQASPSPSPSTSVITPSPVIPSPEASPVLPSVAPSPSPTPTVEYMKVVNIDSGSALTVRNEASTGGESLAKLPNGTVVELLERNTVDGWHKIKTADGVIGFCSADFLEDTTAPDPNASATPAGPAYVKLTDDNVNLRKEATTSSDSLGLLAKDTVLKVLDSNVAGGWYKVQTEGGMTGYCKADFLTETSTGW